MVRVCRRGGGGGGFYNPWIEEAGTQASVLLKLQSQLEQPGGEGAGGGAAAC